MNRKHLFKCRLCRIHHCVPICFFAIALIGFGLLGDDPKWAAFGQETAAAEQERLVFEDDDADAFDEEGDEFEEEQLEELREIHAELLQHLRVAKKGRERADLRVSLRTTEELARLAHQRQKILDAIQTVERRDQAQAGRLFQRLENLHLIVEANERRLDFQLHVLDWQERLAEVDKEADEARQRLAETLEDGLREGISLANRLVKVRTGKRPRDGDLLEEELDLLLEERVDAPTRALELLQQLSDEEGSAQEDELLEELRELEEEFSFGIDFEEDDRSRPEPRSRRRAPPTVEPVLITEESLARYSKMDVHRDVKPLLTRYCFECHSSESSSGELDFEQLLASAPIVKNKRKWLNVIEQTKNHVMPPEGSEMPSQLDREQIVLSLKNAILRFDYTKIDHPGNELARRLSHREYGNTVRDLFGMEIDVVERFPSELTATSGFDNSANSLFIQPLLMERYIGLAEYVVDRALPKSFSDRRDTAWERVFVARPSETESISAAATKVMSAFLTRAFRRPPTDTEVQRYNDRIVSEVANGSTFEDAVKSSLRTVLISPHFLLLTESAGEPNQAFAVGHYELASRLSYFLWASMPDDELLQLADRGELANSDVIATQVDRMIKDPKSESLGTAFASQWLGSEDLGSRVRLDPIDNPWCTETLMAAMRTETSAFFHHLVSENRPITELVNADYTFLNEELARLYRIEGVTGSATRKVSVDQRIRGGVLGHGSVLAVTSFPGRTSPVVRGKWVLDTLLGTPPPPPPPNVSEFSEELESEDGLSIREQLERHRDQASCYGCHSQMDPLGISLEQFDWFGRDRSRRGRRPIDVTGQLPNGTEFKGLAGLKRVLLDEKRAELIRQVTQKLLSYALGRQLEYYDEPAIRAILEKLDPQEPRMGTVVREIALSYPFRYKRIDSQSNQP